MLFAGFPTLAGTLRVATYNTDLSRKGPGLLLRDILSGKDAQIGAVIQVLVRLDADEQLGEAGAAYPYRFALRPNTGMATGLDMDRNGRTGDPRDAQGFGYFSGQDGMAILSRLPFNTAAVRDFSGFLWRDLPQALLPDDMTIAARAVQRLSTTGHWQVPVILPDNTDLTLLFWHATPPVFDGPEDRNGRRNHDEAAFWLRLLAGDLGFDAPAPPFILLGDGNLDPVRGDGRPGAISALLASPALQDRCRDCRPPGMNRPGRSGSIICCPRPDWASPRRAFCGPARRPGMRNCSPPPRDIFRSGPMLRSRNHRRLQGRSHARSHQVPPHNLLKGRRLKLW